VANAADDVVVVFALALDFGFKPEEVLDVVVVDEVVAASAFSVSPSFCCCGGC